MQIKAKNVDDYLAKTDPKWSPSLERLRELLLDSLPEGFEETMGYGMPAYVVPFSIYPNGYHVNPSLPLPFINFAMQKSNIALYHLGIYSIPGLEQWFVDGYTKEIGKAPDMGKSCIRFKKEREIPWKLLERLFKRVKPSDYIKAYEYHRKTGPTATLGSGRKKQTDTASGIKVPKKATSSRAKPAVKASKKKAVKKAKKGKPIAKRGSRK